MNDSYLYVITLLLPISALMLVLEVNPYHALVLRGILGAVAALIYTILGAGDVALTEALVGTLLATMLCAVTVRSSLVFRLGVLVEQPELSQQFELLVNKLKIIFRKYHMQVELISYPSHQALDQALIDKEVHAICRRSTPDFPDTFLENSLDNPPNDFFNNSPESFPDNLLEKKSSSLNNIQQKSAIYQTKIRLRRLYEITKNELDGNKLDGADSALTQLIYINSAQNFSSDLNPDLGNPIPDSTTTSANSGEVER